MSGARASEARAAQREGKQPKQEQERTPSSVRFSYFLMRKPDSLNMVEQAALRQLQQVSEDIAIAYPLMQELLRMMRERAGNKAQLDSWLGKAKPLSIWCARM